MALLQVLWLVPLLPLVGFLILAVAGDALSRRGRAVVGVGSLGLSAGLALVIAAFYLATPLPHHAYSEVLWQWFSIGKFTPTVSLYLDPLSLCFMLIITVVGFLIHLYSSEFMRDDAGHRRYFAYLNLFVASMLTLVLAKNLLLLYLGWEGVGLCSYLLIGHWHEDHENVLAARKAFIVTRLGDAALTFGLVFLFGTLGTLDIQPMLGHAQSSWTTGSPLALLAATLILAGAVGKSAQLPLQTWLPDAMAGPTPVSALIHAATMVTAGVYLIARLHVLFTLAPVVSHAVAIIGLATLLLAATSALAQNDIKRILAYSTISQIGYMFLALGVGAWSAAVFHFMAHAFFKSLLFLSAGAVIMALDDEHDIHRMGDLRRRLPWAFWSFLAGAGALAALPLITSAFYSKGLILEHTFGSPLGGHWLWAGGLLGAFLTAIYSFRMFFVAFMGKPHGEIGHRPGIQIKIPLAVLTFLALAGGFIEIPNYLGGFHVLNNFLHQVLPEAPGHLDESTKVLLDLFAAAVALIGLALAWRWFKPSARLAKPTVHDEAVARFCYHEWGFNQLYDWVLKNPYRRLAEAGRNDWIRAAPVAATRLSQLCSRILIVSQTGQVRWYAAGIGTGAIILAGIVLLG